MLAVLSASSHVMAACSVISSFLFLIASEARTHFSWLYGRKSEQSPGVWPGLVHFDRDGQIRFSVLLRMLDFFFMQIKPGIFEKRIIDSVIKVEVAYKNASTLDCKEYLSGNPAVSNNMAFVGGRTYENAAAPTQKTSA